MIEDEAFIRALVDNPGDDFAGAVYADWLDDCGDPRGPYLRAESEWARPWRGGQRPPDNPELLQLAATLDPVWVARVSRPPVGVRIQTSWFGRPGSPASAEEIDALAAEFGVVFPPAYRAFL